MARGRAWELARDKGSKDTTMHRLKFRQVLIQRVRQRGALLAFFAVAMFGMVVLAGLGTDSGNMLAQNTRLQNSLDAAALSAAKTLSQTIGDTSAAQQEVQASFLDNANSPGNGLLLQALNSGEMTVSAEFSRTLLPFNPGSSPASLLYTSPSPRDQRGSRMPSSA